MIAELPPSIGNLPNLATLNISSTFLQYLPGEFLNLLRHSGSLVHLNIHPNPFLRPDQLEMNPVAQHEDAWERDKASPDHEVIKFKLYPRGAHYRTWVDKRYDNLPAAELRFWEVLALARSPVQYSDSQGAVVSKFKLPGPWSTDSELPEPNGTFIETEDLSSSPMQPISRRNPHVPISSQSRVKSLFELALKSCSKTGKDFNELPSVFEPNAPQHLVDTFSRLSQQSEDNANSGHLPCSICGRSVMTPVAHWIEWWQIREMQQSNIRTPHYPIELGRGDDERPIPFLMRGCSWKCVPRPSRPGHAYPGTIRWHFRTVHGEEIPEFNYDEYSGRL